MKTITALTSIRKKLGLSQTELGRSIGKRASAISNYETKRRHLPLDDAYKIIDIARQKGISISLEDLYPRD
jgi:transcriptional regulator with XRE-family HTH domain